MRFLFLQNTQPSVIFTDYTPHVGKDLGVCAICRDDLLSFQLLLDRLVGVSSALKAHNGLHALHSDCYDQLIENIKNNPKCPSCRVLIATSSNPYLSKLSVIAKRITKVSGKVIAAFAAGGYVLKAIGFSGFKLGVVTGLATSVGMLVVPLIKSDLTTLDGLKISLGPLISGILLEKSVEIIAGTVNSMRPSGWFVGGLVLSMGFAISLAAKLKEEHDARVTI